MDENITNLRADTCEASRGDVRCGFTDYGLYNPPHELPENTLRLFDTEEDNKSQNNYFFPNMPSSGIDANSPFFLNKILDWSNSSPSSSSCANILQQPLEYNEKSRKVDEVGHPAWRYGVPAPQTSIVGLVPTMPHPLQQRHPSYSQQQYLIKQHQQHQQIAEMKRQLELKKKQKHKHQYQVSPQNQCFQQQHTQQYSVEVVRPPYGQRQSSAFDDSSSPGSMSGIFNLMMETTSPKLQMESGYRSPMTVQHRPPTPGTHEDFDGTHMWQGPGTSGNFYQHQQYNPLVHSYSCGSDSDKLSASSQGNFTSRTPSNASSSNYGRMLPFSSRSRPGSYHSSASTPHALYQQQLEYQQVQCRQEQRRQYPHPSDQITVQSLQATGHDLLGQRFTLGQATVQGGSSEPQASNLIHPQDKMSRFSSTTKTSVQWDQQGLFTSKDSSQKIGFPLDQPRQNNSAIMTDILTSVSSPLPSSSTLITRSINNEQSQSQHHSQVKSSVNIKYCDLLQPIPKRQDTVPPPEQQEESIAEPCGLSDAPCVSSTSSSESNASPFQVPPSQALEELVCSCCEDILVNAEKYSLKSVELANTLRARVGKEALALIRDRTGGFLSLLERYPYVFCVKRIPKNDCVTLVQPGKKQIFRKSGGELDCHATLMDHAKLLVSEYSASLHTSGSRSPLRNGSCVLHIGNVPANMNEVQIRREFGEFGSINCLNIVSQNNHRFAFVSFYDEEHAVLAKQELSRRQPWKGSIFFARRISSSQTVSPHIKAIERASSEPASMQQDIMENHNLKRIQSQPLTPPLNLLSSYHDSLLGSLADQVPADDNRNQESLFRTESTGGNESVAMASRRHSQISCPFLSSCDILRSPSETFQQQLQEQQHIVLKAEPASVNDSIVMNRLCDDTIVPTQRWPSNWEVDAPYCKAIAALIEQLGGAVAVSKLRGALRARLEAPTTIKSVPLKALLSAYPSFFTLHGNHVSLPSTPTT